MGCGLQQLFGGGGGEFGGEEAGGVAFGDEDFLDIHSLKDALMGGVKGAGVDALYFELFKGGYNSE